MTGCARAAVVRNGFRALLCVAAAAAIAASPAERQAGSRANTTTGCVGIVDPAADYFPDKITLEDAVNFGVQYRRTFKIVTIKEPYPGGPSERYVLAQCGTPPPALTGELAGAQLIPVPATSLFIFSTMYLPFLTDLRRLDVLTGVSSLDAIDDAAVQARAKAGQIVEFARTNLVIDTERVVLAKPSVLMAGSTSSASIGVLRSAGVPVVANTQWLEPTALGRAEWVKYMALFLNDERHATEAYAATKARYRATSTRALAQPEAARPLVMTGRSTRGTFVIAGGHSFVAALIKDAGARYVWADNTSTGSTSVDLETQIVRAREADIWINGGGWKDRAAMLADEPRYTSFKAFRNGQVWVYERRLRSTGANDYWSRSVSHPDLVLADLAKIFHPALLGDHAFEWYVRVPER